MNSRKQNIIQDDLPGKSEKVLGAMRLDFDKRKEEVWDAIDLRIQEQPKTDFRRILRIQRFTYAAASLAILLSAMIFLRYYTKSYYSDKTELSITLPDDSRIQLEPGSTLKYYPYYWRFQRRLTLEGEAHFEVEKGNTFLVASENASTRVLGTTFHIMSRSNNYEVTCFSGMVEVTSKQTNNSETLEANESVKIGSDGDLIKLKLGTNPKEELIQNAFLTFNQKPVQEVFNIISSRYKVGISSSTDLSGIYYSGNLNADNEVTVILKAICLPLDLQYVKISEDTYEIRKASR